MGTEHVAGTLENDDPLTVEATVKAHTDGTVTIAARSECTRSAGVAGGIDIAFLQALTDPKPWVEVADNKDAHAGMLRKLNGEDLADLADHNFNDAVLTWNTTYPVKAGDSMHFWTRRGSLNASETKWAFQVTYQF